MNIILYILKTRVVDITTIPLFSCVIPTNYWNHNLCVNL